jgi:hypothetical protein
MFRGYFNRTVAEENRNLLRSLYRPSSAATKPVVTNRNLVNGSLAEEAAEAEPADITSYPVDQTKAL